MIREKFRKLMLGIWGQIVLIPAGLYTLYRLVEASHAIWPYHYLLSISIWLSALFAGLFVASLMAAAILRSISRQAIRAAGISIALFGIPLGAGFLTLIPRGVEWGLERGGFYILIGPAVPLIGSALMLLVTIAGLRMMSKSSSSGNY